MNVKKLFCSSFIALLIVSGCAKKPAPTPVAPPPPPPSPTASISANPSSVEKGGSTQLTWRTENADNVTIEGLGRVEGNGSKTVQPTQSTSYRLLAKGPGGEQDAVARVTVSEPVAETTAPPPTLSDEQWWSQNVQDVYFDYDSYDIRPDARQAIANTALALKQRGAFTFTVEGYCDDRGSTEYNIALGDERAKAVKNALVAAGVSASRINTTSYGKEKPFCSEQTEACWQQNRRGHLTLKK
jgi:peptidoglycan-associated lipoprotein